LNGNRGLATRPESAGYVGIPIVSYHEFLVFDSWTDDDRNSFKQFCSKVEIVQLMYNRPVAKAKLSAKIGIYGLIGNV
jgi:hypothetical protein